MFRYIAIVVLSTCFMVEASEYQIVEKRDLSGYHNPNKIVLVNDYKDYVENGIYHYNIDDGRRSDGIKIYEKPSRRLFGWFARLFESSTNKSTHNTVGTSESSYEKDLKERIFLRGLYKNLTEVLAKITEIHKHVSNIIEQRESYTILTKGKPRIIQEENPKHHHKLIKRDANLESSTPSKEDKVVVPDKDNKLNNNKTNSDIAVNVTSTECPCDNINNTSGRRYLHSITPSEVKQKLLQYLKESFNEINYKIQSLKDIKDAFSDDYSFKIGYIIANVDALEVNILNLKNDMEINKDNWEDTTILKLFDTLKVSNQALSGLTESLKSYIDKLASYNAKENLDN